MNDLKSTDEIDISMEDDNISANFANVLKNFRLEFGANDLRSIALGFKVITYKKLMELYDSDPSQVDSISNWILECKFWTILESLLDVKFNKDYIQNSLDLNDVSEYSSDTVIQDKVISSDNELLQLLTCINSLSETFKLDYPNQDDDDNNDGDENELQYTKWHNTLLKLNSIKTDKNLIKNLDLDSPLRTPQNVDQDDQLKDEAFFKRAFKLLMSHEFDDLKSLSEATNNWDFSLMIAGLNDKIDPIIDLKDFSKNTIPSGVKFKILRRRTIYQLAINSKLNNSPYERACYGILSSDFLTVNELTSNWEEKLFIYLNNLFHNNLENKILKLYQDLDMNFELNMISKLSKPPVISNSVDEIFNKLANDKNQLIKDQSKHSIRVLIGSIISDNVKLLMENTIKSIDDLISVESESENETGANITNEAYLLRILTHLAIILQLIYGEEIINNDDYIKILNCYIYRLNLYKQYELVPVYISFIPTQDKIIDIYSTILLQFEYSSSDRINQINGIKILNLPIESIIRETIEKSFKETINYYPTNSEIQLNYEVDLIDEKLFNTIYWSIDAGMIFDCLEAIIILLRRFLLVGKIGSAIKFLKSISLPQLIDNYKYETSVLSNLKNENNFISDNNIPHILDYKLHELTQYHNLFSTFQLLLDYDYKETNDDKLNKIIDSLYKIIKTWMFDLVNDKDDNEIIESDIEIFEELRRIYIPTIFNTLFDILIENMNKNKKFEQQAVQLVNLLADEKFKIYDILNSTNELKPFLSKFADF
ncbi:Nucleoporin nup84, partial [Pichia californica]